jgi:poly-gamma-glutamate capsule biosynthesis protein CapA/YwtB (metallophosphatase superfamily)
MTRGAERPLTLFVCGDVMTGRAVDQIMPRSVPPVLHEPHVASARTYVALAEAASGPIPRGVPYAYVWGDALAELRRRRPDARIVNLEAAVTTSDEWWHGKRVHYRMHPDNVALLGAAGIDVCVLGNNHVMDWGRRGLRETLATLEAAAIRTAGAGLDSCAAAAPAVLHSASGRLLVFSYASPTSGVPPAWRAQDGVPGVNLIPELDAESAREVARHVLSLRAAGDRVVISLHWGGNWGYEVPARHRDFAHRLVDAGAADVVHGHSSHHPKAIEVYEGRAILYGCGDLINDYEGIGGHERYRGTLVATYFLTIAPDGALASCELTPFRIRRFRLERAPPDDARWLATTLDGAARAFGSRVAEQPDGRLALRW